MLPSQSLLYNIYICIWPREALHQTDGGPTWPLGVGCQEDPKTPARDTVERELES